MLRLFDYVVHEINLAAMRLIGIARKLYAQEPFGVDLANTAYALDSTTIDLSSSLFPGGLRFARLRPR